jgi:uncharacterized protein
MKCQLAARQNCCYLNYVSVLRCIEGAFDLKSTASQKKSLRWRVLGRVVLFFLACATVLAMTVPLTSKIPGLWPNFVLGAIASLGALTLTALFVRWDGLRMGDVGAAPVRGSLPRFALGFLIGLLLVALCGSISAVASHVQFVRAPAVGFAETSITLITFIALSCREELSFHGYPLRCLERSFGLWSAQIIVAVVFAAEHMAGGWPWTRALLGACVGSLAFGMAAIATRGLALPIGLHAAWNFGDWMLGGKGLSGIWTAVVEEGQQGRAQLVRTIGYLAVMGSATIAFWIWYRCKSKIPISNRRGEESEVFKT